MIKIKLMNKMKTVKRKNYHLIYQIHAETMKKHTWAINKKLKRNKISTKCFNNFKIFKK